MLWGTILLCAERPETLDQLRLCRGREGADVLVGYMRISTAEQSPALQRETLLAAAVEAACGYENRPVRAWLLAPGRQL